ncbi:MAG: TRAP transporter small permease, partial [Pseudodonghicola sp.]
MFRKFETVLNTVSALAVAALCLLIAANVLSRSLLGVGVPDSVILVRELMVAAILCPLAAATGQRAHVAIDFIAVHFPPGLRRWIGVLAALVGLMVALPLLYAGW